MRSRSLAALLFVVAASCSRCGGTKSAQLAEELVPVSAGSVVSGPLAGLAQHAAALVDKASQLPGGEQLGDMRKALAAQLGFDPLTRDGLLSAGVDPDRGFALALQPSTPPSWVIALPLVKPDLFLQTFDRLARERAGYALRTDEARGDVRVALYARDPQARQKLGAAVVRGYGLVSRGDDPAAAIAHVAALKPDSSLARDARYKTARERLGGQDLIVFAPAGSDLPRRFTSRTLPGDVGVGLSGTDKGVSLKLFAQLPGAQADELAKTLPGGGNALVELLPASAPFKLRLGLSAAELVKQLDSLGEARALREKLHGADVRLVAALEPGAVLSLGLSKTANLAQALDYGLDFRRKSPFDTVELVALARVADRPRALEAMEVIAQALPSLAAKVVRREDDWQVSYAAGQGARFGLRDFGGKPVAYLLGGGIAPGELQPAPRPAGPAQATLWSDPGAALQLDLGKLSDAVRALPDGTYGNGPQAFVSRALVSQVIEPLRPLRVTASALPGKDGLRAEVDVEIVAP